MAEYDGEMAGTVALRKVDEKTFEFTKMAVDEKFRRRGLQRRSVRPVLQKQGNWVQLR